MGDSVPAGGRDGVERHLQTCPLARHAGFSASNLLAVCSFWWIRFTYSLYLAFTPESPDPLPSQVAAFWMVALRSLCPDRVAGWDLWAARFSTRKSKGSRNRK